MLLGRWGIDDTPAGVVVRAASVARSRGPLPDLTLKKARDCLLSYTTVIGFVLLSLKPARNITASELAWETWAIVVQGDEGAIEATRLKCRSLV
jgi:hypothetical protein